MNRRHHEGPRRPRGRRFDDLGNQWPRTHAASYRILTTLWRRPINNGTLSCELLSSGSGRLVRFSAQYVDVEGTSVCRTELAADELQEAAIVADLTERIRVKAGPHWKAPPWLPTSS